MINHKANTKSQNYFIKNLVKIDGDDENFDTLSCLCFDSFANPFMCSFFDCATTELFCVFEL